MSARYPDRAEAIAAVDLDVAAGELVAVLGPNGAGKTTLLRVLAGTLAPTKGDALLFGRSIAAMDRREIARELAVVTQQHDVAFEHPVRDVVMMGRAPHQGSWMRASEEDRAIVEDAIAQCDLTELADRSANELSGGEQKRVAIARALAQSPKVMLLDEPSAFLDLRHAIALYELLARAVRRDGLASVVVMHDVNMAAQFGTRVVLMKSGRVVAAGAPKDVLVESQLRATFDTEIRAITDTSAEVPYFVPIRATRERET